jgi:hypothetical protein
LFLKLVHPQLHWPTTLGLTAISDASCDEEGRQIDMLESIHTCMKSFSQLPRLERGDWHSFHWYIQYNYEYIPLPLQLERGTPSCLYRNLVPIELLEELFPLVSVKI